VNRGRVVVEVAFVSDSVVVLIGVLKVEVNPPEFLNVELDSRIVSIPSSDSVDYS
jgi:hypothetical protein